MGWCPPWSAGCRGPAWLRARVLSRFICVRFFAALWIVACSAPLSVRFSRQEYWSRLPCPPPRDLPYPGIKPLVSGVSCIVYHLCPLGSPKPGAQPHRAAGLPGRHGSQSSAGSRPAQPCRNCWGPALRGSKQAGPEAEGPAEGARRAEVPLGLPRRLLSLPSDP